MQKGHSLKILAQAVARTMGLTVSFGGDTAFTDGKRINFPVLKAVGSDIDAMLMPGLAVHEGLHVKLTDFNARKDALGALGDGIANLLEDVRIERNGQRMFAGGARLLGKTIEAAIAIGWFQIPKENSPGEVLVAALLHTLRAEELDQHALDPLRDASLGLGRAMFGPLMDEILAIARDGSRAPDTAGVVAAAREILKRLQQAQQPQSGDEGKTQESSESNKPQSGGEKSQGEQEASAASQGKTQDRGEQNGETADASDGQQGKGSTPDPAQVAQAAADALSSLNEELPKTDLGELIRALEANSRGTAQGAGYSAPEECEKSGIAPRIPIFAERFREKGLGVRNTLGMRLGGLLEAKTRASYRYSEQGRFVSRRLARALCNDDARMFRVTHEGLALDTACFLLVDSSGSMCTCLEPTGASLYALSEALEEFGVPFAVAYFNCSYTTAKDFEEPLGKVRDRIYATAIADTALAGALGHALEALLWRPEARRILLVLTDGETSAEEVHAQVRTARELGIETVFLLIGSAFSPDFVAGLPVYQQILSTEEIPKKTAQAFAEAMNLAW